jgi:hypothetical protein
MDSNHPVPGTIEPIFVAEGELRDRTGEAKKGCFLCGTDGSNPFPSSSESDANLNFAGPSRSMTGHRPARRSAPPPQRRSVDRPTGFHSYCTSDWTFL